MPRAKRKRASAEQEEAAAVAPIEESNAVFIKLAQESKAEGTIKHYETVKGQFLVFLAGRAPTAALFAEFLNMEATKEDGSPAYKASSLWSRRTHILTFLCTLPRPIDISHPDGLLQAALKARVQREKVKHAAEFKHEQLFDFWARAPNEGEWLLYKAISLVGFYGLAPICELWPLR